MKILFDARVHLNYFSGISRYIICLLNAYLDLFPNDELIVLLNPSIKKDNSIYKTLNKYSNITFKVVNAGHMGPKNYYKMGKIIKSINPDVYHYPHLDAPIFTGNIPIIATVHDVNSNNRVKKYEDKLKLKSLYFKTALKLTLKKATKIIFVSNAVKNEVAKDFKLSQKNEKKCITIHNGLEEDFNKVSTKEIEDTINSYNINAPYLLYVGQIREHKNIRRIVEAYQQVYKQIPTHNLIIVGYNYLNLSWKDKNITHIDKVNNLELKALYAGATSLLFPSLFEGFGFPIIEAFSFGKQVVTTNYGATKEVADGHAILVDPNDTQSIAEGIKRSITENNNAEERRNHAKSFSWKKNAQQLREIYLTARK